MVINSIRIIIFISSCKLQFAIIHNYQFLVIFLVQKIILKYFHHLLLPHLNLKIVVDQYLLLAYQRIKLCLSSNHLRTKIYNFLPNSLIFMDI